MDKYFHSCPSCSLGPTLTRARVNLKTWDKAAKMRMHSSISIYISWNKWSSWCMSKPVGLKYWGNSCVLIELSCLSLQCFLDNLQSFEGLLSLMALAGFFLYLFQNDCVLCYAVLNQWTITCVSYFQICFPIYLAFIHL